MKCKNDPSATYKGDEPSPKGIGICAHAEPTGAVRKGRDGNAWVVIETRGGVRRWAKRKEKTDDAAVEDRRSAVCMLDAVKAATEGWWIALAQGGFVALYKDGTHKLIESDRKTRAARLKQLDASRAACVDDATVKGIVLSAMSRDVLTGFAHHILHRSEPEEIKAVLRSKGGSLAVLMQRFPAHFKKYKIFSDKDYVMRGSDYISGPDADTDAHYARMARRLKRMRIACPPPGNIYKKN